MTHEHIDVDHIAELCRIELTPDEKIMIAQQLDTMITYIDQLKEVDVSHVEAVLRPLENYDSLREDVPGENLPTSDLLRNAPASKNNQVIVPRIVE